MPRRHAGAAAGVSRVRQAVAHCSGMRRAVRVCWASSARSAVAVVAGVAGAVVRGGPRVGAGGVVVAVDITDQTAPFTNMSWLTVYMKKPKMSVLPLVMYGFPRLSEA